jgi:hypothetical protein
MTHGGEHAAERSLVGRREDVDLYARTYSTVLRSSGEVRLRAFERAHTNVWPSLHGGASSPEPDTGALIYAVNRLPSVAGKVGRVILGQLPEHFAQALGRPLDDWLAVQAPARRRQWHYDGRSTLAVHVASASDIDDVIPTLVAYQIEWNKLHARFRADARIRALVEEGGLPDEASAERVREHLSIGLDDWQRLVRALGEAFWPTLRLIAASEKDFAVRLLGRGGRPRCGASSSAAGRQIPAAKRRSLPRCAGRPIPKTCCTTRHGCGIRPTRTPWSKTSEPRKRRSAASSAWRRSRAPTSARRLSRWRGCSLRISTHAWRTSAPRPAGRTR